ncbi:MAG: hypothetical protein ACREMY_13335, partial [bacterium]
MGNRRGQKTQKRGITTKSGVIQSPIIPAPKHEPKAPRLLRRRRFRNGLVRWSAGLVAVGSLVFAGIQAYYA